MSFINNTTYNKLSHKRKVQAELLQRHPTYLKYPVIYHRRARLTRFNEFQGLLNSLISPYKDPKKCRSKTSNSHLIDECRIAVRMNLIAAARFVTF